jgi:hypothetical protein
MRASYGSHSALSKVSGGLGLEWRRSWREYRRLLVGNVFEDWDGAVDDTAVIRSSASVGAGQKGVEGSKDSKYSLEQNDQSPASDDVGKMSIQDVVGHDSPEDEQETTSWGTGGPLDSACQLELSTLSMSPVATPSFGESTHVAIHISSPRPVELTRQTRLIQR